MPNSNYSELRRIRAEMSAQAGHDVRCFIELLDEVRERYRDRLVNHGAATKTPSAHEPAADPVANGESSPPAL